MTTAINIREFAGSDEIYVKTEEDNRMDSPLTFICVDGTAVALMDVCDGIPHCPDSSDEVTILCRHIV